MKFYFITFRSVTFAQRGEKAARQAGIACTLQRTPKWMEEQGCGYSLRLRKADVLPAVTLFRENEIPFRKVYARQEDGKLEELKL